MNKNNAMLESILEEVRRNPILTEEELNELMYFPSEEEIRQEEEMTEVICRRIELYEDINGIHPTKDKVRQIIEEEEIKRSIL